jgi:hypothetical protein
LIFGTAIAQTRGQDEAKKATPIGAAIAMAALTLVLGLINPYYLVLVAAVLAAFAAWNLARGEYRPLWLGLAAAVGAAGALVHYQTQSISGHLGAIRFDEPIGPLDVALFFSILLPCAVAGWLTIKRDPSLTASGASRSFFIAWSIAALFFSVAPILPFRARMTFGLGLAFSIPAAAWFGARGFHRPLSWALYCLLGVEIAFTFYKETIDFQKRGIGSIDRGLVAAFDYIDRAADRDDLVLTSGETGNFLPAFCRARVYAGHSFQTENYVEKTRNVEYFLRWAGPGEREAFAESIGARFILIGPRERQWGGATPLMPWPKVYDESGYAVYQRYE